MSIYYDPCKKGERLDHVCVADCPEVLDPAIHHDAGIDGVILFVHAKQCKHAL